MFAFAPVAIDSTAMPPPFKKFLGRPSILLLAAVLSLPSAARGQDDPKQLQAKYDDAVTQLKAAQDRKNELSVENDSLKTRLAEIEAKLKQLDDETAERTFHLRASNAAWNAFLEGRPDLRAEWDRFIMLGPVVPEFQLATTVIDPAWPLRGIAAEVLDRPAGRPATVPATQPTSRPASNPSTTQAGV